MPGVAPCASNGASAPRARDQGHFGPPRISSASRTSSAGLLQPHQALRDARRASPSSPVSGASSESSSTTWRAKSSRAFASAMSRPLGADGFVRRDQRRRARPERASSTSFSEPAEGSRAARDACAASTSARSSCWPWISTSSRADALQQPRADRLIVDEARVRPSANCTRRRIKSRHRRRSRSRAARRGRGGPRAVAGTATTCPLSCAVAGPATRRRGRQGRGSTHRAGWICPRRSRRSAP